MKVRVSIPVQIAFLISSTTNDIGEFRIFITQWIIFYVRDYYREYSCKDRVNVMKWIRRYRRDFIDIIGKDNMEVIRQYVWNESRNIINRGGR